MAHDYAAIADLIADKADISPAEVSDLAQATPLLAALPLIESSNGTVHKYTKEIGAPVVGFRAENTGRAIDHGNDALCFLLLEILDWSCEVDKAVADSWHKGGASAFINREAVRHLKAALVKFETQVIYGDQSPGDTAGFAGLLDNAQFTSIGDACLSAGGSSEGQMSSIWALHLDPEGIAGVYRGDGIPMQIGPIEGPKPSIAVDSTGKSFPSYYRPACTWLGLQVATLHSARRLANVSTTVNDNMLSELLESFPTDRKATHMVMSRRSVFALQRARNVAARSPDGSPAPMPKDYNGTPIIVSDNISDTESVVS